MIMTRVGLAGFVVLVGTIVLFYFPNATQREEIIDTWVLLKNPSTLPSRLIIAALGFLLVVQHFHTQRVLKRTEDRLKEIADEKRRLQEKGLGPDNLTSSDTP